MDTISEENKIEISSEALDNLNVTWRWTTFLSVLGFIFLGLIIVAGIATSLFLTVFKTQQTNLGIPESLNDGRFRYNRHPLLFPCILPVPFLQKHTRCNTES